MGNEGERSWSVRIDECLDRARKKKEENQLAPQGRYRMFRVPDYIRENSLELYTCQAIGCGLFRREWDDDPTPSYGMKTLRYEVADTFIQEYRQGFMDRDSVLENLPTQPENADDVKKLTRQNEWKHLCAKVVGLQAEAKQKLELYDHCQLKDPLVAGSLLTLDAVFVTVFLLYFLSSDLSKSSELLMPGTKVSSLQIKKRFKPLFNQVGVACNLRMIFSDIWLLDYQIPLSLIQNVWKILCNDTSEDAFKLFIRIAVSRALRDFSLPSKDPDTHRNQSVECVHLLECLYKVVCPEHDHDHDQKLRRPETGASQLREDSQTEPSGKSLPPAQNDLPAQLQTGVDTTSSDKTQETKTLQQSLSIQPAAWEMPLSTVTELQKAGIRVRGVRTSFSEVKFTKSFLYFKATLWLPHIKITANTDRILRNLCVFEHVKGDGSTLISYFSLLDELINTVEDVKLMQMSRDRVLSISLTGEKQDERVANMFNSMLQNYSNIRLSEEMRNVHDQVQEFHGNEIMHLVTRTIGRLRHERDRLITRLVGSPWLFLSAATATLLLTMTAIQTSYTVVGYYK